MRRRFYFAIKPARVTVKKMAARAGLEIEIWKKVIEEVAEELGDVALCKEVGRRLELSFEPLVQLEHDYPGCLLYIGERVTEELEIAAKVPTQREAPERALRLVS